MQINKLIGGLERKKMNWLLIVSALFFFLLSVNFTELGVPEASPFWYAYNLHWTFWFGLLLSVLSILLSIKHTVKERFLSVLLPVLFLYTLPSFTHEMIPVFDVYHVIPPALDIIESGVVDLDQTIFPLSHLYYAENIMILDLPGLTYARLFPTILTALIVVPVFTVAKRYVDRYAVIAPLVFFSANWYMEYHLARQAFGLLIWLCFWLFFILYIETRATRLALLGAVFLLSIIPSHPGMLIIVFFNLSLLAAVVGVRTLRNREMDDLWPVFPFLAVFGVTLLSVFYLSPHINDLIMTLYRDFVSGGFQGFSLGGPAKTSAAYMFTNHIRRAMGLFQSIVGLIAFILYYRYEKDRALLLGAWFLSCYFWLSYSLIHNGYLIERAFMTALLPASILIAAVFKKLKIGKGDLREIFRISAVIISVSLLLLIPVAKNSVDSIETPTRQSYRAGRFSQANLEGRVTIMDTHEGLFRYLESSSNSSVRFRSGRASHPDIFEFGMKFGYPVPQTSNTQVSKIIFTDYFENYIIVRYGDKIYPEEVDHYERNISQNSLNVYESGTSRIYIKSS